MLRPLKYVTTVFIPKSLITWHIKNNMIGQWKCLDISGLGNGKSFILLPVTTLQVIDNKHSKQKNIILISLVVVLEVCGLYLSLKGARVL